MKIEIPDEMQDLANAMEFVTAADHLRKHHRIVKISIKFDNDCTIFVDGGKVKDYEFEINILLSHIIGNQQMLVEKLTDKYIKN